MIVWALWTNRNDLVWNGKSKAATSILNFASSSLLQWESAQQIELKDWRIKSGDGAIAWSKPRMGEFKCNVDGAVFAREQSIGFGCVIRNHQGRFIAARKGFLPGSSNPKFAEAMGVREALGWIKEKFKNSPVSLETDSLCVIQAIRGLVSENTYFQNIIEDCLNLLKDLPLVSCIFVRRSANRVAHILAKATDSSPGVVHWESIPPLSICNALQSDLST
ncbi:hypothetical protein DH2020_042645 [Rehmannia glutinosa]|uniref:RNase H type-1 domain-containing protein n=1 Tax=Rehmannia glutinosa TaxID=99300 RepID=A0ABR0UMH6_REHGL